MTIGENLSVTKTDEVGGSPINEALQALPIIPVRTVDGMGWGGPVGGMNDRQNPVRLLEDNKQNDSISFEFLETSMQKPTFRRTKSSNQYRD